MPFDLLIYGVISARLAALDIEISARIQPLFFTTDAGMRELFLTFAYFSIRFDLLVNKPAPGAARFHHRSQKGGGGFPSPWSTPPPVL